MNIDLKIQIVACGPGIESINKKHGRSCYWLKDLIEDYSLDIEIVEFYSGEELSFENNIIWIIMGSRYSAYSNIGWIKKLEEHIKKGIDLNIPMLGICFGHQIICKALGSTVVKNPKGWEVGSSEISLTSKGLTSSLFADFKDKFYAYESHQDTVINTPSNIDILACNDYGIQAFSYLDYIYGVQFHPEFSFEVMEAYYNAREDQLDNKNIYKINDKNDGANVVGNFIKLI